MKKSYKIAIDVSPLSDGNSVRGVGYYTKNLVDSIHKEIKTNKDYSDFDIQLIAKNSELTGFDLVHYPYFDPFFLTLPSGKLPFIVSVHDLMPIEFKKYYPVGIKGNLKWLIQRYRLFKAKYILTDSHYSKYVIHDLVNYPLDRIFTTHLASDKSFQPITELVLLKKIQRKYKLPHKFVLYIGDINWNKNIPSLVKACQALNYPLVIVGSNAVKPAPNNPWAQDIRWLQDQVNRQNDNLITLTGFVPDEDLPSIFNLATIYCQPSFAEGFGLPVLQAMQSGCPLVYSNATSLPEIVDYNGLPFDPHNQTELENCLSKFWNDEKLRQSFIKKGLKRAATFSWQQTALSTLAVYRLALLDEKI